MKLYELKEEMLELYNGDAAEEALEKVAKEIKVKAESIAKFIKNLDSDARAVGDEIKELQGKKKAIENNVSNIKKYVKQNLESLELKSIDAGIFKFSIVDVNKPTVDVEDAAQLPEQYQKRTISADKIKILEDYKLSGTIPMGAIIKDGYSYLKIK